MSNINVLPAEKEESPLPAKTSPPLRILVVDDDADIRRFSTEALTRSGYEVDAAEDGDAAWNALQRNSYDLLVTDNKMPKVTGIELLQKLRAARMVLPAIMATGTLPPEFTRFPWLQPAATLLKPYTGDEMVRTVKKVLGEAQGVADDCQTIMNLELKEKESPPTAKPTHVVLPAPPDSSHRILVVDEDRDLRLLYAEALARPGYHVDAAEDGEAGWEALQAGKYHLLITENDLPKLNGVELVTKMRAARMALPVVMAAGRLPTHELARNPALQLAATLVKPFAVEVLLETVRSVLYAKVSPPTQTEYWSDEQDWS